MTYPLTCGDLLSAGDSFGQLALLTLLLIKRRVRGFPTFAATIAAALLRDGLVAFPWGTHTPSELYARYWQATLMVYAFQASIILEMTYKVLRLAGKDGIDRWAPFAKVIATAVVLTGVVVFTLPTIGLSGKDLFDLRWSVFSGALMFFLYLAMNRLANRSRLQRASYLLAVGNGMTVLFVGGTLCDLIQLSRGWRWQDQRLELLMQAVYLVTLAYWFFVFSRPERLLPSLPELDLAKLTTVRALTSLEPVHGSHL